MPSGYCLFSPIFFLSLSVLVQPSVPSGTRQEKASVQVSRNSHISSHSELLFFSPLVAATMLSSDPTAMEFEASFPSCKCRPGLTEIQVDLQHSSLDVVQILNAVEALRRSFSAASQCWNRCTQSAPYTSQLIQSQMRLLDFLEVLRRTLLSTPEDRMPQLTEGSREERSLAALRVTGCDRMAKVNRYPLNEGEKKLLVQAILRESLLTLNTIAKKVHHELISMQPRTRSSSIEVNSAPPYSSPASSMPSSSSSSSTFYNRQNTCTLYRNLITRTYSALATCNSD
ncbi:hypothetical protein BO82DRAFT_93046 [Aspergillus uvarum CBS 121591]|uniref:Aflatoxin regulatory protein domain-containing protein n=1 Tax=Aspergillus uvarum CBS 121591 TaxID=1448315 RepID=A0A319CAL5_9EURO|nr:hypothetical protein BO82DRAFT_93046 [Aspergillus uvarum CBS 121591]PYH81300.1 hypothetical protein BO82DRAFT_93046 [Aspergillus uvarum CBS 121591]